MAMMSLSFSLPASLASAWKKGSTGTEKKTASVQSTKLIRCSVASPDAQRTFSRSPGSESLSATLSMPEKELVNSVPQSSGRASNTLKNSTTSRNSSHVSATWAGVPGGSQWSCPRVAPRSTASMARSSGRTESCTTASHSPLPRHTCTVRIGRRPV